MFLFDRIKAFAVLVNLFMGLMLLLVGCASKGPYRINLMPAPEVYGEGKIDPFVGLEKIDSNYYSGIFYATDREPADAEDQTRDYRNKRGHLLRLGLARVELSGKDITWEEARRVSLLKNRTEEYPLVVTNVEENGVLEGSLTIFDPPERKAEVRNQGAGRQFADSINRKLSVSARKDIYIYVHGFKVVFENPVLVASELWHYLGYEGVFIAYAWPSTPSNWAYAADLETAVYSARNLRLLLDFLCRETDAERIHLIGYSAGTRVVIQALTQLTLMHAHGEAPGAREQIRIGRVILVGSDFDRDIFAGAVADGLLKIPGRITIYMSEADKALSISRWLFGDRPRLGQLLQGERAMPHVESFLRTLDDLVFINVTNAESATAGNGHAYFRKSPWVSSDVLMSLKYDLSPEERGLARTEQDFLWHFPPDYITRLRSSLATHLPE